MTGALEHAPARLSGSVLTRARAVPEGDAVEITVLGPLTARERGTSVVPTAAKQRQLLALLALRADRVVPVGTLMDELWGERAPRSAAATLQTYVVHLRRRIAAAHEGDPRRRAHAVLETHPGGYALHPGEGPLDYREFDRLAESGRRALRAGDARSASADLTRALALWRGPALVDVPAGRELALDALRMEETRMAVLERRVAADLRLGRHAELVPELRVLTVRHPLHETFCAQLMTALHHSGSAWRALAAYQHLRATLVHDLGLEPSAPLRRLHHAILTGAEPPPPEPR